MNLIETPTLQEAITRNLQEYEGILQEQIFLQDQGVSFQYTDSISFIERKDLIEGWLKYLEIKNQKIAEAAKK